MPTELKEVLEDMEHAQQYLIFILIILCLDYLLSLVSSVLTLRNLSPELPQEFQGLHDAPSYAKSQEYTRTTTSFSIIKETVTLPLTLLFILLGGFNWLDSIARTLNQGEILTGIVFFALLSVLTTVIDLPFSIYHTFVIEERFGFNRTTIKTFVFDLIKGFFIALLLGGILLAVVVSVFTKYGAGAWAGVWLSYLAFMLLLLFIYPVSIAPLFNKFTPLADGELKTAIDEFANRMRFKRKGLFTMDGSKRSTKSNAYFTGYGRFRRIVLFDTLIEKHTIPELVSVLAHEIGHYKKRHILQSIILQFILVGFWCWLFSRFLNNPSLFAAFRMEHLSIYASLLFFAFLISPIATIIGIASNWWSRKHEYEADAFAAKNADNEAMIMALKKLSLHNLSNLTPHPFTVALEYSHPPVLARIAAIRALKKLPG